MNHAQDGHPGRLWMPRSRGAVCGLILVILGAWGALIPFVGPHFNFAYTPDKDWAWSTARGWPRVVARGGHHPGGPAWSFFGYCVWGKREDRDGGGLAGGPGRRVVRDRWWRRSDVGDRVRRRSDCRDRTQA